MGVQCAIFERESLSNTVWSGAIAGYIVGYTLTLFILYSLTPILFRLSSAMFYNLSLLTSGNFLLSITDLDFWGLIIGIKLFGFYVYKLYPVAFVMTIGGILPTYPIVLTWRTDNILYHSPKCGRRGGETMAWWRKSTEGNCRNRHLQTQRGNSR
jgi:hypothetical protein